MKSSYITGSVCTITPDFQPARPPTDTATNAAVDEGERVLAAANTEGQRILHSAQDEGKRLLELTRQLHQRVYTTEQRLNMLSDMVQAQQPK